MIVSLYENITGTPEGNKKAPALDYYFLRELDTPYDQDAPRLRAKNPPYSRDRIVLACIGRLPATSSLSPHGLPDGRCIFLGQERTWAATCRDTNGVSEAKRHISCWERPRAALVLLETTPGYVGRLAVLVGHVMYPTSCHICPRSGLGRDSDASICVDVARRAFVRQTN